MSLIGQTLGQYQIIKPIGAGGMASVYKAYQPGLDRHVAVKVLPAQHALAPGFKERFIREARAVARLSHPNILPIYDVGLAGDLSYFVMKFVSGPTLRALLGKPMDLPTVSRYIDQLAGALDHAHTQGIIHRDIKPTNILIEDDWLYLADFGLAKIVMGSQELTGTGAIVGTPTYLAPEQGEGKPVDHRADIYSLGVVLYEMVTGQVPFDADSPMGIIFKHIYEPLPSPRLFRPDLPAEVEQVILKAMAKDAADRYDKALEMAQELRRSIRAEETEIIRPGPTQSARIFICYKRNLNPDEQLANYLFDFLTGQGYNVFIDRTLRVGGEWLAEIDQQLQHSDFLVVLLSQQSADSEMVQAEIKRAYEYRKLLGKPKALPVRMAYQGLLPYSIDAFLDPLQYVVWQAKVDNERVGYEVLAAITGQLPRRPVIHVPTPTVGSEIAEDGRPVTRPDGLHPPLPEFDPRYLEAPGGVVKLRDRFYIERHSDAQLKNEVIKVGTTTTIRAARQTGKSSLLVRGVNFGREHGAKVINLDLQRIDADRLASPDLFLRDLAESIVRKLRLDAAEVERAWQGPLGPQDKLTYLLEDYVLPESDSPIILALDEVDRLLTTPFHNDFFALLRSWHNSRALDEQWDRLNMVMVISTEPYLLIADANQSPFNVGLKLYLEDFNEAQVRDLNQRHGEPLTGADFAQLLELLGGHPYLTRKALYLLLTENLSWADLTRLAPLDQGPFGDHLRRQQWLLRNEPDLQAALRQVIEQHSTADEMALFRLLQAGLVKGRGDAYSCRCDLYRLYFKDKL
ncbi:MAG: AAA-like domain-containing protein [Chloroflexota bacterium]